MTKVRLTFIGQEGTSYSFEEDVLEDIPRSGFYPKDSDEGRRLIIDLMRSEEECPPIFYNGEEAIESVIVCEEVESVFS